MAALHFAAAGGHLDAVKALVAHKANVNQRDYDGRTPLHHAALGGHKATVDWLLSKGKADATAVDDHGMTAAALAASASDKVHTLLAKAEQSTLKRREVEERKRAEAERKALEEAEKRRLKELAKGGGGAAADKKRSTSLAPSQTGSEDELNKADRWISMIYSSDDLGSGDLHRTYSSSGSSRADSPALPGATLRTGPAPLGNAVGRTSSDPSIVPGAGSGLTARRAGPTKIEPFTPDPVPAAAAPRASPGADEAQAAAAATTTTTATTTAASTPAGQSSGGASPGSAASGTGPLSSGAFGSGAGAGYKQPLGKTASSPASSGGSMRGNALPGEGVKVVKLHRGSHLSLLFEEGDPDKVEQLPEDLDAALRLQRRESAASATATLPRARDVFKRFESDEPLV